MIGERFPHGCFTFCSRVDLKVEVPSEDGRWLGERHDDIVELHHSDCEDVIYDNLRHKRGFFD